MDQQKDPRNVIILFSGGFDSTLLIHLAQKIGLVPFCILYNYGQKHKKELKVAEGFCVENNIDHALLKIPIGVTSKLTYGEGRYEGVSEWHVPARNLTFMSFAVGIAEEMGIGLIWYGANYTDRENLFPDCTQEWVYRLNQLLEVNGSRKIKVEAPLVGMTKETIEKLGKTYGVTKENTFSGYGNLT